MPGGEAGGEVGMDAGLIEIIDIPPASGVAFTLEKDQRLRIIDVQGQQVGDLVCFNLDDPGLRFSAGRTRTINNKLRISVGDLLYGDSCELMMRIVADTCGVHDLLYPPCCRWVYEHKYGKPEKAGCLEHLAGALSPYGLSQRDVPDPFNVFMHTEVGESSQLIIHEPRSHAGDYIDLRAEMDLLIGLSACAAEEGACNAGRLKPLRAEIYSGG
jgi:uncharacterized protein YcgI (DUF1989 family)